MIDTGLSDQWQAYNSIGALPGTPPVFGSDVIIGLITYAYEDESVPFVGTEDSIRIDEYRRVQ